MPRCMCGAGDCKLCFPKSYKAYMAWEKGEIDDLDDYEEPEPDEDLIRYRRDGEER